MLTCGEVFMPKYRRQRRKSGVLLSYSFKARSLTDPEVLVIPLSPPHPTTGATALPGFLHGFCDLNSGPHD